MAAWADNVRARMRGNRGESITEVLVSIVVGGLAILMLATAIASAAGASARSEAAMDRYFAEGNELAQGAGADVDGTVALTENGTGRTVRLADGSDAIAVDAKVYELSDGVPIVSYEREGDGR